MSRSNDHGGRGSLWVIWADDQEWSAHALLLEAASRVLCIPRTDLEVASSCPRCGSSDHGRPLLRTTAGQRGLHASLSRAPGLVVIALTAAGPVGVDVEQEGAASFDGFDDVALHSAERADGLHERTVTWVRKESLLKAVGYGLTIDPRGVRLGSPRLPPAVLSSGPDVGLREESVWMFDVRDAPAGYAVSVTVLSDERPTLVTHQAAGAALFRPATR